MANIPATAAVYEGKNVRIQSGDNATLLATVDANGALEVAATLAAGTANIGDVDVLSIAAGTNNIGAVDSAATTPTLYAVTLTNANTEYTQALPATCRRVALQCRTSYAVRLAFVTGKVATPTDPYLTIPAGATYDSGPIKLTSGSVFLASAQAGVVVEIEAWS